MQYYTVLFISCQIPEREKCCFLRFFAAGRQIAGKTGMIQDAFFANHQISGRILKNELIIRMDMDSYGYLWDGSILHSTVFNRIFHRRNRANSENQSGTDPVVRSCSRSLSSQSITAASRLESNLRAKSRSFCFRASAISSRSCMVNSFGEEELTSFQQISLREESMT